MIPFLTVPSLQWQISDFFFLEEDAESYALYGVVRVGGLGLECKKIVGLGLPTQTYWLAADHSELGTSYAPAPERTFPGGALAEKLESMVANPLHISLIGDELHRISGCLEGFLETVTVELLAARPRRPTGAKPLAFLVEYDEAELERLTLRLAREAQL